MTAPALTERAARVALLERFGGEAGRLRRTVREHGTALAALREGVGEAAARRRPRATRDERLRALAPGDADWPARLDEAPDPPALLFAHGRWPAGRRTIAVVGARDADEYGRALTRRLAAAAAAAGWLVVSGGARGVDAEAHEAALALGAPTVVVLGGGHARPYPAEHRALFERAADTGAVLSEYPPWRSPRGRQFPERNRIVAALADVVLVTQAGPRSGSLATARAARRLGRPVLAVPGDVCYRLGSGVAGLLATGAHAVVGPAHLRGVLDALAAGEAPTDAGWPAEPEPVARRGPLPGGWPPPAASGAIDRRPSPPDGLAWLTALLSDGTVALVDDVVAESGRPTAEVLRALVALELEGLVERVAGGRVRLAGGP